MSLGVCWDARLQVLSTRFSSLADTFQAKGVCLFAYIIAIVMLRSL